MNQDIRHFLQNCNFCGQTTIWRDKKRGLLKPLPVLQCIWQEISMDFITDLPPGKDYKAIILLVITDLLGKVSILLLVHPGKFDAKSIALHFVEHLQGMHTSGY